MIWFKGFSGKCMLCIDKIVGDLLVIDVEWYVLEFYCCNNYYWLDGLLKGIWWLDFIFFFVVINDIWGNIFWSFVLGWNNYDKFMVGFILSNYILFEQWLEWWVVFMYGFGSCDLIGLGVLYYNIYF